MCEKNRSVWDLLKAYVLPTPENDIAAVTYRSLPLAMQEGEQMKGNNQVYLRRSDFPDGLSIISLTQSTLCPNDPYKPPENYATATWTVQAHRFWGPTVGLSITKSGAGKPISGVEDPEEIKNTANHLITLFINGNSS